MRPIFTFAILLLSFSRLMAQPTYKTKYQAGNKSDLNFLLKTKDGGNTAISWQPTECTNETGCHAFISAHHFNAKGILIWSKDYRTDISFSRPEATETPDGGFAFFGRLYDSARRTYKGGLLVKCDREGNVQWSKQLQSDTYPAFIPQALAIDDAGNFLLVYTVGDIGYSSAYAEFVKISSNGNIVWNTVAALGIRGDDAGVFNFIQKGNRYYLNASVDCSECQGSVVSAELLVINATTGEVAIKSIGTYLPNFEFQLIYPGSLFGSNKALYLQGWYYPSPSKGYTFIVPFTDTTTSAYATTLPDDRDQTLQYQLRKYLGVFPFRSSPSSYYDADGSFTAVVFNRDYFLIQRYDPLGRICPDFTIPVVDSSTSKKLFYINTVKASTSKDKLGARDKAVSVTEGSMSYTRLCYSQSSSMESNDVVQSVRTVKNVQHATVFPNPAGDVIHVIGIGSGGAILSVLSPVGVILQTLSAKSGTMDIAVSDLQPGQYFLRVTEKGKAPYTVPFIKQGK